MAKKKKAAAAEAAASGSDNDTDAGNIFAGLGSGSDADGDVAMPDVKADSTADAAVPTSARAQRMRSRRTVCLKNIPFDKNHDQLLEFLEAQYGEGNIERVTLLKKKGKKKAQNADDEGHNGRAFVDFVANGEAAACVKKGTDIDEAAEEGRETMRFGDRTLQCEWKNEDLADQRALAAEDARAAAAASKKSEAAAETEGAWAEESKGDWAEESNTKESKKGKGKSGAEESSEKGAGKKGKGKKGKKGKGKHAHLGEFAGRTLEEQIQKREMARRNERAAALAKEEGKKPGGPNKRSVWIFKGNGLDWTDGRVYEDKYVDHTFGKFRTDTFPGVLEQMQSQTPRHLKHHHNPQLTSWSRFWRSTRSAKQQAVSFRIRAIPRLTSGHRPPKTVRQM